MKVKLKTLRYIYDGAVASKCLCSIISSSSFIAFVSSSSTHKNKILLYRQYNKNTENRVQSNETTYA